MKDYSAMSDLEINAQVSRELYGPVSRGHQMDLANGTVDYCNNPADAWPIIVESGIGVMPFKSDHARAWDLSKGLVGDRICHHANPLRAAMIVYLMMKDAEKGHG